MQCTATAHRGIVAILRFRSIVTPFMLKMGVIYFRDSEWGIRDIKDLKVLAENNGLELIKMVGFFLPCHKNAHIRDLGPGNARTSLPSYRD